MRSQLFLPFFALPLSIALPALHSTRAWIQGAEFKDPLLHGETFGRTQALAESEPSAFGSTKHGASRLRRRSLMPPVDELGPILEDYPGGISFINQHPEPPAAAASTNTVLTDTVSDDSATTDAASGDTRTTDTGVERRTFVPEGAAGVAKGGESLESSGSSAPTASANEHRASMMPEDKNMPGGGVPEAASRPFGGAAIFGSIPTTRLYASVEKPQDLLADPDSVMPGKDATFRGGLPETEGSAREAKVQNPISTTGSSTSVGKPEDQPPSSETVVPKNDQTLRGGVPAVEGFPTELSDLDPIYPTGPSAFIGKLKHLVRLRNRPIDHEAVVPYDDDMLRVAPTFGGEGASFA